VILGTQIIVARVYILRNRLHLLFSTKVCNQGAAGFGGGWRATTAGNLVDQDNFVILLYGLAELLHSKTARKLNDTTRVLYC
jgi:hypothetical protein